MNVTREVIDDLMPLYFSGEASAATRRLVEEFLENDPDYAALATASRESTLAGDLPHRAAPEADMRTLAAVKRMMTARSLLLGLALFLTLTPATFTFSPHGVHWIWADAPWTAAAVALVALLTWVGVAGLSMRLRATRS